MKRLSPLKYLRLQLSACVGLGGVFLLLVACDASSGTTDSESRSQELRNAVKGPQTQAGTQPSLATELLLLQIEGDLVTLRSRRRLAQGLPRFPRRVGSEAWSFDALDEVGAVIHQDNFIRPGVVRGEFRPPHAKPGAEPEFVRVELSGPQSLSLRVPTSTHSLRFYQGPIEHRRGPALSAFALPASGAK